MQQNRNSRIIGSVSHGGEIARDRALLEKAQNSPEAFGQLFDLYYGTILSYALRRTGDAEVAEDIVAETFIKAFKNIRRFAWRGTPLSAWLYRIAGNEIKMHYRRPKKSVSLELLREGGFDAEDLHNERELMNDLLARDAKFAAAMAALRALPLRYQEAITLRYIEEKEIAEIAVIMAKREGSVRSLLSRGLGLLRTELSKPLQQTEAGRIIESEGRSVLSILKQN